MRWLVMEYSCDCFAIHPGLCESAITSQPRKMMEEDLFSDSLFCIAHYTPRDLNKKNDFPDGCIFETYHLQSLESGSRLRSSLSSAVINALVGYPNGIVSAKNQNFKKQTGLANGFIQNPHNLELREQIASGRIAADTFLRRIIAIDIPLSFSDCN